MIDESLCKSLCKGNGERGANAACTPTNTSTFTLINTVAYTQNEDDIQTYNKFDTPQNLCNTVCKRTS